MAVPLSVSEEGCSSADSLCFWPDCSLPNPRGLSPPSPSLPASASKGLGETRVSEQSPGQSFQAQETQEISTLKERWRGVGIKWPVAP